MTKSADASTGDSGLREYDARMAKPKSSKSLPAVPSEAADFSRVRIYFPSRDTVRRSRGGSNVSPCHTMAAISCRRAGSLTGETKAAGTICFSRKWWEANTFPRGVLRDCVNVRSGVLMHTKIMFVRRAPSQSQSSAPGWFYLGSHNLSESAW